MGGGGGGRGGRDGRCQERELGSFFLRMWSWERPGGFPSQKPQTWALGAACGQREMLSHWEHRFAFLTESVASFSNRALSHTHTPSATYTPPFPGGRE